MELLLALLSLLTAATGAVAGVRAPEAGVHQTAAGIVAVAPAPRIAPRLRVLAEAVPLPGSEPAMAKVQDAPRASPPLETERLIE